MKEYSVARDAYGYAIAIEKNGSYILHLDRGTDLNEKNIDWLVAVLNAAASAEPNDSDTLNARLNDIASTLADLNEFPPDDFHEARRELQNEYDSTYAKLVQLRQDK